MVKTKLRILVAIALLATRPPLCPAADDGDFTVMFWNLENFFDFIDEGGGEADTEFSARGARHWTKRRFQSKCAAVAKGILWVADRQGRLPDVIGLAEVENAFVLRRLLGDTPLRKTEYAYVHFDSPDHRGMDVALLYNAGTVELLSASARHIHDGDSLMRTRDILLAHVRPKSAPDSAGLWLAVNHHPSKYGGNASGPKRLAAMSELRSLTDSVAALGPGGRAAVIAMGDFNDTPDGPAFDIITASGGGGRLVNAMRTAPGEGSIRYGGKWELIDLFFTSPGMDAVGEVVRIPFLMTWDNVHAGMKPLRTWTGPRWTGGVSDHCPILLCVRGGGSWRKFLPL